MIIFKSQKGHSDHGVKNGFMDVGKLEVACPVWGGVMILRRGNGGLDKKSRNEERKKEMDLRGISKRTYTRLYNCCSGCGRKGR